MKECCELRHIKSERLRIFFTDVFEALKCPSEIYQPVIEGLLETSLRGVDSHGIRLIAHYVDAALLGRINLRPRFNIRETSPTTILLDADDTFGITAAHRGMKKAMELAKRSGMGCAAVYNSSHFGAAAIYGLMAARANMIGISLTHTDALVFPHGGREPFLGTNPICFACPTHNEEPFCLDMSTSIVSWNKLLQHKEAGQPLEPGWAADRDGTMCTDPNQAKGLLALGGYKGYGLGLMVEVLCSLLTGMPFGKHIERMYPVNENKRKLGHFLMAIDIERFQGVDLFKERMKDLLDELRSLPPAEGFSKVMVAEDPQKEMYRQRSQEGIPVDEKVWAEFERVVEKLKIKLPQ